MAALIGPFITATADVMKAHLKYKRLVLGASLGLIVNPGLAAGAVDPDGSGNVPAFWQSLREQAPDNLELSVAGGLHYEDNLVVDSIDVVSTEKDVALTGKLNLDYRARPWNQAQIRSGYAFSQRWFQQQDEFDLQTHYGFIDLSRGVSGVTAGAVVGMTYASVGGNSLLEKQGIGGYLNDLATRKIYWRADVELDQTDIKTSAERSSTGQRLDLAGFYFIDGPGHYFVLRYRYHQEQADSDLFDYHADRFNPGYVKRFTIARSQPVRVRLDWRYERRRYQEFDPGLGARRRDDRERWRLRVDTPINAALSLQLKYEHRTYRSNNPTLDFDDNSIEALLELKLL
jgi:hypothetical protein